MYYEINEATAKQAKTMKSFDEYKAGSATEEYKSVVDDMVSYAEEQKKRLNKNDEERISKIDYWVEIFCIKYANWVNRYNQIDSYCPSIMITGGSNFPTRKKRNKML